MPETIQNFIDGEWTNSESNETFDVLNPANGTVIARAQLSSLNDIKDTIAKAAEVRDKGEWATNPRKRATALLKLADAMESKKEELARWLTMENGKPINLARAEIVGSADHIRFYAGLARALYGRSIGLDGSSYSIISREPMGLVGHIVPWNYPIMLMFRALAASLAAGNVCIVKPASYTPVTSTMIMKIVASIPDFPRGVLNHITGPGPVVGAELARSSEVDMVALTGDNKTGKEILRLSSESVKKVALELGGKSPNIVFPDADPNKVMAGALSGAFLVSGQVCMAGSRVLVDRTVHDDFVKSFKAAASRMKVGDGLEESTELGPIISKNQMERILEYIELGKKDSNLVTGGNQVTRGVLAKGNFIEPTVFDHVPNDSKLGQEEIFGPVAAVMEFEDEDEAVRIANDTKFGLAAAIWTKDVKRAFRLSRRIRAGTIWINAYGKVAAEVEYGGFKQSGVGRERGMDGLFEFTQAKHIYFDLE